MKATNHPKSIALTLCLLLSTPVAIAGPAVLPPQSKPLGTSIADWAGAWWNWVSVEPAESNPLLVDNCNANQDGKVFFLPHTFFGDPINRVETFCTVPTGTMIFASVGGTAWWNDQGQSDEDLREDVINSLPDFQNPRLVVDGIEVGNINEYLVVSDVFTLTLPDDNIFGSLGGTFRAVVGGWHVMLAPLPPGEHTIILHDELVSGGVAEAIVHLTVLPGRGSHRE